MVNLLKVLVLLLIATNIGASEDPQPLAQEPTCPCCKIKANKKLIFKKNDALSAAVIGGLCIISGIATTTFFGVKAYKKYSEKNKIENSLIKDLIKDVVIFEEDETKLYSKFERLINYFKQNDSDKEAINLEKEYLGIVKSEQQQINIVGQHILAKRKFGPQQTLFPENKQTQGGCLNIRFATKTEQIQDVPQNNEVKRYLLGVLLKLCDSYSKQNFSIKTFLDLKYKSLITILEKEIKNLSASLAEENVLNNESTQKRIETLSGIKDMLENIAKESWQPPQRRMLGDY